VTPSPDLCAAKESRVLINQQAGRFDVTTQRATRLELAAFSHENIAPHRPSHFHRFRPDLTAYARVLPDRERSGGIDCLESLVKASCVETLDYSGYKHYHNYGLIATTLQLLPRAIECVVR